MNRIQDLLDDDPELSPFKTPSAALWEPAGDSGEQPNCLFTPQHYEPNYAYPLIVWLHGPNDDQRQVNRILPLVSLRNYVAVGPRGTVSSQEDRSLAQGGFAWSQEKSHIIRAEARVFRAVRLARRWLNIAPHRIFLAGYDCGGTMALRIALSNPTAFAGVLSIGGGLPTNHRPFARLHELRGLQVFLATGRDSLAYPQSQVCRDLRLFHSAGMAVNLRQYPCGDEVTTEMLADMDRWIMEQISATVTVTSDQPTHRH
jgi:phospholipase/carboxylesterase